MPGFLYYLPTGAATATLDAVRAAGLSYAISASPAARSCMAGPDGRQGVVFCEPGRVLEAQLGYWPDRQTWRALPIPNPSIPQSLPAWLGFYPDAPPGPEDLARSKQLAGHEVELLDGGKWIAPVARGYIDEDGELRWYHAVPRVLALDEAGHWSAGGVVRQYAALWDLACRWDESRAAAADTAAEGVAAFSFDGLVDAAIAALATNYAIGRIEASLLGILSEGLAVRILDALVDLPTRVAWVKKNQPAPAGPPA